ncbi:MAG TPA: enolase C-terminal domain-like protein [Acidimicrobiales bacterium]|nr:enolase C-terminal domain-like protein [Acidimicrobiales bacterium]
MSADARTPVQAVDAAAYTIPTDQPESDGTLAWDATTIVVVEATAGGETGLGYTYAHPGTADLVARSLAPVVQDKDALAVGEAWAAMVAAVRNQGRPGIASTAISAVDTALWDLKARLLGLPLAVALDAHHDAVPVYGSGGFCSYPLATLAEQLAGWVQAGIPRVKMKVARHPDQDDGRLAAAREAIGPATELLVDANGAFSRKQALRWAHRYADAGVTWLEEPVSSDDLAGLRLLRDQGPAGMDIAAGEYGYDVGYFARMLEAQAVDCLQADVTRCGGFTGFRQAAALCDAAQVELSAHCAPQLSTHACAAAWHVRDLEYFHDHVRIESLLFDGVLEPEPGGLLRPDRDRPGHGLALKRADAARFAA